jgi:hypothetical protein
LLTIIRFPRAVTNTLAPIAAFDFVARTLPDIQSIKINPSSGTFHPVGTDDRVILMQHGSRKVFEFFWDGQKWVKDCTNQNTVIIDLQMQYNGNIDAMTLGGARFKLQKDLFLDVRINGYYNIMSLQSTAFTIYQQIDLNNSTDTNEPTRRFVLTGVEEREVGPLLYSQIRMYGPGLQELTDEEKPVFNLVAMTVIQKKSDCSARFAVGGQKCGIRGQTYK